LVVVIVLEVDVAVGVEVATVAGTVAKIHLTHLLG
jgi:hypothetical protein